MSELIHTPVGPQLSIAKSPKHPLLLTVHDQSDISLHWLTDHHPNSLINLALLFLNARQQPITMSTIAGGRDIVHIPPAEIDFRHLLDEIPAPHFLQLQTHKTEINLGFGTPNHLNVQTDILDRQLVDFYIQTATKPLDRYQLIVLPSDIRDIRSRFLHHSQAPKS